MFKTIEAPWKPVFRRIRAIYRTELLYPPKPSVADLDAAEKEIDFRFPASYRAFAETFGLGGVLHTLPEILALTRPPGADKSEWYFSVVDATRFLRAYDWEEFGASPPANFMKRMVVFAFDEGEHTFVFDPEEVTDTNFEECAIYDIPRHGKALAIATSFGGWLDWIDNNYRFEQDIEEQAQDKPSALSQLKSRIGN